MTDRDPFDDPRVRHAWRYCQRWARQNGVRWPAWSDRYQDAAVDAFLAGLRYRQPDGAMPMGLIDASLRLSGRDHTRTVRRRQSRLARQPLDADLVDPGSAGPIAAVDDRDEVRRALTAIGEPEATWLRRIAAGDRAADVARAAGLSRRRLHARLRLARRLMATDL